MQTKNKQEINARYRKKLSNIAMMEKSRDQLTEKELHRLTDICLCEAQESGLDISFAHDGETDLYTVTIKNEGTVQCTLRRLPSLINGLRVMGDKVRALYFKHQKKLQSKTK